MIRKEVKRMKLYSENQTANRRRAVTRWRLGLLVFCALALSACIWMMCHTGTGNAARFFWSCLILFTLSGWLVILARQLVILPHLRTAAHESGILHSEEKPVSYRGILTRAGVWFTLPSSITLMKYTLVTQSGETVSLCSEKSRVKLLPEDGAEVTVTTVRGFITEVDHEA